MTTSYWISLRTLYIKEIGRFLKVYNQTLVSPMISALTFLAVFYFANGKNENYVANIPFINFMACGLIIMSIVQNAFANTCSVLVLSKVMGTVVDYLLPPFSINQRLVAVVAGGITRGILVGLLVYLTLLPFINIHIYSYGWVLFYTISASAILALFGIIIGILAETFDQMSAITSYLITPLSFLSGTFYSIHHLPSPLYTLSHCNPFFYMIDGFRYGMLGYSDTSITLSTMVMFTSITTLWAISHQLFKTRFQLKA
jgi:ABC-2 type transport system permease protein